MDNKALHRVEGMWNIDHWSNGQNKSDPIKQFKQNCTEIYIEHLDAEPITKIKAQSKLWIE